MIKIFDNFNSLRKQEQQIMYKLYNQDENDEHEAFATTDIIEMLTEIKRRKVQNGLNWNENLLLSIEDLNDNPILWVDVRNFECFF